MRHRAIRLSGSAAACAAVSTELVAMVPLGLPVDWILRGQEPHCEIREGNRAAVAATWEAACRIMLTPPVPLSQVRVVAPWGGRRRG